MLSPKVILAPIDFSESSLNALNVATDIAKQFGSAILLFHVVAVIPKLADHVSTALTHGVYELELIEGVKRRLGDLAESLRHTGVHLRSTVRLAPDAASEIIRTAETEKAELIVIATNGLRGWRRLVFGSVAEKVVRTADCPVLVLRGVPTTESQNGPK